MTLSARREAELKTPDQINARVEDLLKQLTLNEKVALLSGKDVWNTVAIPRLHIPSITMTDGPHGIRAVNPEVGRKIGPTTAFPTGISMGAAWNVELIERVGEALGEETRGMDCDILLGPCVNIVRGPLGGRNFETFSEDPYLTGRTAVSYIRGVQRQGVGTSLKHYAVNNYEIERFRASSEIDERTLREIYLPHFEMAVREAQPWTVMCSYNRVNGTYASQHEYLLKHILKEEWGFEGALISDWGAVHDWIAAVRSGLDLEMPGPQKYFRLLNEAVENWQLDPSVLDEAAGRVLRLVVLSGRMEKKKARGAVNTPSHQALARTLAEEAITLLRNENAVLPIDRKQVRSLAVIGPNAAEAVIEGGGSSRIEPPYRISPLEALQKKLGKELEIRFEPGCDNFDQPFTIPGRWLVGGLEGTFYPEADFQGVPFLTRRQAHPEFWWHVAWSNLSQDPKSVRWVGSLTLPEDGQYLISMRHNGQMRFYLDGERILESRGTPFGEVQTVRALKTGKTYEIRLDYTRSSDQDMIIFKMGMARSYPKGGDPRLARAVELARSSDMAVVFAGFPEAFESEGSDRLTMDLPGRQAELIGAVAAVNPRTVVVLNAGAPVSMPWLERVSGVLLAYYPGQENGNAVARILLGEVNPSGKLPVTFPVRLEDTPAFFNSSYPDCREVLYGEGIFVGYRYYDKKDVPTLFPFGHGLSYTDFSYSHLKAPHTVHLGEKIKVSLRLKNAGKLAGKEVVQLYVSDVRSSLPRPLKELKGFAKVALRKGESKTVTFTLEERDLSYYDPVRKTWVAERGEFELLAGSSSKDIRLRTRFKLI